MGFKVQAHPLLPPPTLAQIQALAQAKGISAQDAFVQLHGQREDIIRRENEDPLRHGWEPPIWQTCYYLLDLPWVDSGVAKEVRALMGFDEPVRVLLILGGNRGSKSEFAAKLQMKVLVTYQKKRGWALHSKEQMSIDYQQPLVWKYLPKEWRRQMKTPSAYIAYRQKTGFSDGSLVLPNLSDLRFFNYTMDRKTVEGGNLDTIWPDELVPPDWVETMELRIAEKGGFMVITFTPVDGYTPTVRMFQEGALTTWWSVAWLCPKDGGPPDLARALGLSDAELAEMRAASMEKRPPTCPWARPENTAAWSGPEARRVQEAADRREYRDERGRVFELVPRVMKPLKTSDAQLQRAIVFFHSSDNPYGNPLSVWSTIAGKSAEFIKERFYGIGHRLVSARFPKFNHVVHVIPRERAMALVKGATLYHVFDPANARNFCMLWAGITKDEQVIAFREWPGRYPIPEVGVPGPWAVPGDADHLDGKPGPGQKSFGFGYWRYKRELARLEGWKDYLRGKPENVSEQDWIIGLDENGEKREPIFERIVDSRFASSPKMENDRPSTLMTDFAEIGVSLKPAPAKSDEDMIQAITDALDYDTTQPVGFLNQPKLLISEDCGNLAFALSTWTGQPGRYKSATRDPINVLGYLLQSDPVFVENGEVWQVTGGGTY